MGGKEGEVWKGEVWKGEEGGDFILSESERERKVRAL